MVTRSYGNENPTLTEANRQLRVALDQCQALLKRTEEMLRRSQEDNDGRYTDS